MKVPKSCRHKARNYSVRIDGKQKYPAVTFDENGADPHFMQKTQQRLNKGAPWQSSNPRSSLNSTAYQDKWAVVPERIKNNTFVFLLLNALDTVSASFNE